MRQPLPPLGPKQVWHRGVWMSLWTTSCPIQEQRKTHPAPGTCNVRLMSTNCRQLCAQVCPQLAHWILELVRVRSMDPGHHTAPGGNSSHFAGCGGGRNGAAPGLAATCRFEVKGKSWRCSGNKWKEEKIVNWWYTQQLSYLCMYTLAMLRMNRLSINRRLRI